MTTTIKVKDLQFSDLYLGHPTLEDRFSDVPGAEANPLPAWPSLKGDLDALVVVCRQMYEQAPLATVFKVYYDDVAYRVSVMHTLAGNVFVLRRIADTVLSLAELGIPQAYLRHLLAKDLSGLLLISGSGKAGKTMTGCSIVKERLTAHGGVAVTGENPIELPLEGSYGQGVCYQTTLPRERRDYTEAFGGLLRRGARIVFIDEVRDQQSAAEVLQASISGHLVITTIMAESVIHAITRLHALAQYELPSGSVQPLLADGLLGALHQQLRPGTKAKLEAELLFFKDAPVTRTVLRSGRYELLESEIRQQQASMISENASAQRFASA